MQKMDQSEPYYILICCLLATSQLLLMKDLVVKFLNPATVGIPPIDQQRHNKRVWRLSPHYHHRVERQAEIP